MATTSTQRMQKLRKKEKAHLASVGAKPFNMTVFGGTRKELDQLKSEHDFEEDAEIITLMIHNLAKPSHVTQKELLSIPESKND